jgi:hypothetical protein
VLLRFLSSFHIVCCCIGFNNPHTTDYYIDEEILRYRQFVPRQWYWWVVLLIARPTFSFFSNTAVVYKMCLAYAQIWHKLGFYRPTKMISRAYPAPFYLPPPGIPRAHTRVEVGSRERIDRFSILSLLLVFYMLL